MAILLTLWPATSLCDEIIGKVNTKTFILQLTTLLCYWCTQYIYSVLQIRSSNIWSFACSSLHFWSHTQIMLYFLTDKILVWKPFLLQAPPFFFWYKFSIQYVYKPSQPLFISWWMNCLTANNQLRINTSVCKLLTCYWFNWFCYSFSAAFTRSCKETIKLVVCLKFGSTQANTTGTSYDTYINLQYLIKCFLG